MASDAQEINALMNPLNQAIFQKVTLSTPTRNRFTELLYKETKAHLLHHFKSHKSGGGVETENTPPPPSLQGSTWHALLIPYSRCTHSMNTGKRRADLLPGDF